MSSGSAGASPRGLRAPAPALLLGVPVLLALHALALSKLHVGLDGGVAAEALRGIHLVVRRRLDVMSFAVGPSAETLWLYVVGASVALFGPSTASVVWPTILAAVLTVAVTVIAAARLFPEAPPTAVLLLSGGSVWLFHYGQSGLRTVAAPVFFLLALLAIEAAGAPRATWRPKAAAGGILGLSVYAYSACRVLPLAWLAATLVRELRKPRGARALKPALLPALLAMAAVSIPNILFLLREPDEFLSRGYYVYRGGALWKAANVLYTALVPFHLPAFYRTGFGPGHAFDETAVVLTAPGIDPVDPVTAALFVAGLVLVLRSPRSAGVSFTLWTLGLGTLLLGVSGPSLTRLLILQPAIVLLAAAAFGRAWARARRWRPVLALLALVPATSGAWAYVARYAPSTNGQRERFPALNAMGARARDVLAEDPSARVLLVAARGRDVAKVYVYRAADRASLVEGTPPPRAAVDAEIARLAPTLVLVERAPDLDAVAASLGGVDRGLYREIRLPPPPAGAAPPGRGNLWRLWNEIRR